MMMSKVLEFLNGKKTYITAFGIAAAVIVQAFGVTVPEEVWWVLGALGLTGIRSALKKIEPTPPK